MRRKLTMKKEKVYPHKKIAWATSHLSNGVITHWSRWHIVNQQNFRDAALKNNGRTFCEAKIPRYTKWITASGGEQDYRIQGGLCQKCNKNL